MDVFIANVEGAIIALRYFLAGTYVFAFLAFVSGVRIPGPDSIRRAAAFVCAVVGLAFLFRVGITGYVLTQSLEALSPVNEAMFNWSAFVVLAATGVPLMVDYWIARAPRRQVAA